MNTPWIDSPFFEDILKTKTLSEEQRRIAVDYHQNGFVVISNLFDLSLIDTVQKDTEKAFDPSFSITTYRDEQRIQDLWMTMESSKHLACAPALLNILEML